MKNELARLTGISLCSPGISARRVEFLPYDSSSLELSTAHARQYLLRIKYKQKVSRIYSGKSAGLKIPYLTSWRFQEMSALMIYIGPPLMKPHCTCAKLLSTQSSFLLKSIHTLIYFQRQLNMR